MASARSASVIAGAAVLLGLEGLADLLLLQLLELQQDPAEVLLDRLLLELQVLGRLP